MLARSAFRSIQPLKSVSLPFSFARLSNKFGLCGQLLLVRQSRSFCTRTRFHQLIRPVLRRVCVTMRIKGLPVAAQVLHSTAWFVLQL